MGGKIQSYDNSIEIERNFLDTREICRSLYNLIRAREIFQSFLFSFLFLSLSFFAYFYDCDSWNTIKRKHSNKTKRNFLNDNTDSFSFRILIGRCDIN